MRSSQFPSPSTSTLESSRGEQNDYDLIDDNVFQSADKNDEQELRVENKKNLELLKVPRERKSPTSYPENILNNIYVNYCRVILHIHLRRR